MILGSENQETGEISLWPPGEQVQNYIRVDSVLCWSSYQVRIIRIFEKYCSAQG